MWPNSTIKRSIRFVNISNSATHTLPTVQTTFANTEELTKTLTKLRWASPSQPGLESNLCTTATEARMPGASDHATSPNGTSKHAPTFCAKSWTTPFSLAFLAIQTPPFSNRGWRMPWAGGTLRHKRRGRGFGGRVPFCGRPPRWPRFTHWPPWGWPSSPASSTSPS